MFPLTFQKMFLWSCGSHFTRTSMNKSISNRQSPSCFSPRRLTVESRPCWPRPTRPLHQCQGGHWPTILHCCSFSSKKVVLQKCRTKMSLKRTSVLLLSRRWVCCQRGCPVQFPFSNPFDLTTKSGENSGSLNAITSVVVKERRQEIGKWEFSYVTYAVNIECKLTIRMAKKAIYYVMNISYRFLQIGTAVHFILT